MQLNAIHSLNGTSIGASPAEGVVAALALKSMFPERERDSQPRLTCIFAVALQHSRIELRLPASGTQAVLTLSPTSRGSEKESRSSRLALSLDSGLAEQLRSVAESAGAVIEIGRLPGHDPICALAAALTQDAEASECTVHQLYARSLALTIAARVLSAEQRSPSACRRGVCPLPKWRLRRVDAFIDAHMARPIALADLAEAAGLSPMYFAAQFRAARGMSPHDYLRARRIERAQERMSTSSDRLIEIALGVGFQTQAHFTTVFRRVTGTTPRRWREQASRQRKAA